MENEVIKIAIDEFKSNGKLINPTVLQPIKKVHA